MTLPGAELFDRAAEIARRGAPGAEGEHDGVGGVGHAPLNTLNANWAYMAIVSIAWSLKAWFALTIPVTPRWRIKHDADRERVLRMEFRSFVQRFMLVPTQILRTGRQLVYRLLAWRARSLYLLSSA